MNERNGNDLPRFRGAIRRGAPYFRFTSIRAIRSLVTTSPQGQAEERAGLSQSAATMRASIRHSSIAELHRSC